MSNWSAYFWLLLIPIGILSQPNCDKYKGMLNSNKYQACLKLLDVYNHYEFDQEYHNILEEVIALDSTFALAYQLRSDPYLKSGNFIRWKFLIDQSVKYNPEIYLSFRAYGRFLFFQDYQGAIKDIEQLITLNAGEVDPMHYEKYNIKFIRALCYRALNENKKSLNIMEALLHSEAYWPEKYDILHLGVLYFELGRYQDAISTLLIHEASFNLAETQYYLGKSYQQLNEFELAQYHFEQSKKLYNKGVRMENKYVTLMDEISYNDIITEFK